MFDVEKELNEIRSINVSPPLELIKNTKIIVQQKSDELERLKKQRRKNNILKFTGFAALPAAAAVLFAVVIGLAMPKTVAEYTLDINPNLVFSVDEDGYVINIESYKEDAWKEVSADELEGQNIEYAISQAIISAEKSGYINESENVLIGCFGEDEYNNISKNLVLSYLKDSIADNINLLSVHGTKYDWNQAKEMDVSAGLYMMSTYADEVGINKNTSLDKLVSDIETAENKSINQILNENAEPIKYKAPQISYSSDSAHIIFSWEYIDYKNNNYDGNITYQLVSADSYNNLLASPQVFDEYTFTSWDKQTLDYTMEYTEENRNKYYSIIAIYDDGTRAIEKDIVFVP